MIDAVLKRRGLSQKKRRITVLVEGDTEVLGAAATADLLLVDLQSVSILHLQL